MKNPYCRKESSPRPLVAALLVAALLGGMACGELRPLPGSFEAREYTPISYGQLCHASHSGLQAGQKIRVPAYFWEYLTYDPAMVRNYLTYPRHPLAWHRLRWFATYGTPEMREYFDLAALDKDRVKENPAKRMDQVMIYGEMSSLGVGLYLRVHRLEKIQED